ncbi:MAG: DUF2283 domain-containing protein [Terrimicrobiaceae bacterium]
MLDYHRILGDPFKGFLVASTRPPTVEIDTEATATYVRFGRGKVARTEPYGGTESLVMVDYDKRGRVLGIEFIGRKKFNVAELLGDIPVSLPKASLDRARYVAADLTKKG